MYTFEGCSETAHLAKKNFEKLDLQNIDITIGDFEHTLKGKLAQIENVDLAFIDGNHQKKPTINYFEEILKFLGAKRPIMVGAKRRPLKSSKMSFCRS